MTYDVISMIYKIWCQFSLIVYISNSLGHIYNIPISHSYWDTSGILLVNFHNPSSLPGNFIDVFLKRKS